MDQLDLAIHAAAHDHGLPDLAMKLGIREQVLRNKVNPTDESHRLAFREWVALLAVTGDMRSLDAVCRLFGGCFMREEEHTNPKDLLRAVLAADAEHGDVTASIKSALADGNISARELSGITLEIDQAQVALSDLRAFLLKEAGDRR